jgi:hypothetical protein
MEQQRAHEQRKAQELEDERLARQLQAGTDRPAFGSMPQKLGDSSQSVLNRDGTYRKMAKPSSLQNAYSPGPSNNVVNGGLGSTSIPSGAMKPYPSYVNNASQFNLANRTGGPLQGASGTAGFGFGYAMPSNIEPYKLVKTENGLTDSKPNTPSNLKKEVKSESRGTSLDLTSSTPPGLHPSSSSSSLEEITLEDFLATVDRVNNSFTNIPVRNSAAPVSGYGQSIQRNGTGSPSSVTRKSPLGCNGAGATGIGPSHPQYGAFGSNVSQIVRNVATKIGQVLPSVKALKSPHGIIGAGSSINGGYNSNFLRNPSGNLLGSQGLRGLKPSPTSSWYPGANPLADLSYLTGLTAETPINVEEEYPDRSRYDYLYSDPTRTADEIKVLLENIRSDEDLPPEMRTGTPDEMSAVLMEHQKLGLTWLQKQEDGTNKGGILADDMGLGKTIQAIALMVSRRSDNPRRKTNLIVAPVALLRQWESEIADKVKARYALKVYRHHGHAQKASYQKLREYDVVLTTFGTLAAEFKRREKWLELLMKNPQAIPTAKEKLALLGEECLWYR